MSECSRFMNLSTVGRVTVGGNGGCCTSALTFNKSITKSNSVVFIAAIEIVKPPQISLKLLSFIFFSLCASLKIVVSHLYNLGSGSKKDKRSVDCHRSFIPQFIRSFKQ